MTLLTTATIVRHTPGILELMPLSADMAAPTKLKMPTKREKKTAKIRERIKTSNQGTGDLA